VDSDAARRQTFSSIALTTRPCERPEMTAILREVICTFELPDFVFPYLCVDTADPASIELRAWAAVFPQHPSLRRERDILRSSWGIPGAEVDAKVRSISLLRQTF
jgi:hypothetical protein